MITINSHLMSFGSMQLPGGWGRCCLCIRRDTGRRGKLEDESYLIIAVSPWRTVMLSVARCISTLRTGNPVGIRHSSLKKEACNCLQHDLRPTCILKHRSARFGSYRSKGKRKGGRRVLVQTSRKKKNRGMPLSPKQPGMDR